MSFARALAAWSCLSVAATAAAQEAEEEGVEPDPEEDAAPAGDFEEPPRDAGWRELLQLAEEAMTVIEYDRARHLAERAIEAGEMPQEAVTRAYRLIAVASAQLDDHDAAERAFQRLFALDPEADVTARLAPQRRSAAMTARGFWSARSEGFGLDVAYDRREREVEVTLRDPLEWVRRVEVWTRFGTAEYVRAEREAAPQMRVAVSDVASIDAIEVYVWAADEHGNALAAFGTEREPHLFEMSDEEVEAYLRRDIRGGQSGSYALRLAELGVDVGMHGYISLELKEVGDAVSFDVHHITMMLRAKLLERVSVEMALEWEHIGTEFYIPHAFFDVRFVEQLILRVGFFEAPIGAFNEYLYPDFLRITGLQPIFSRSIVPALWSEVGLQLRGRVELGDGYFTYAAFVGNGLTQNDSDPADAMLEEGGDIREMRFNDREEAASDKGVGGRLGLEFGDFDIGLSGYTGRYIDDVNRRLSIFDADASFRNERVTLRAEAALALQQITSDTMLKYGLYALAAVRVIPHLELYAQYDFAHLEGDTHRGIGGVAIYPFPLERATRSLRLKGEAGAQFDDAGDATFVWFVQFVTGF